VKVFIGNVVWRDEAVGHGQSMRQLWRELDKRGIEFQEGTVSGDALVSRSRSIAASAFLRSDCDVLLSIDSDIWFRPDDAIALCEKAIAYDVIAGLYVTRGLERQPALMLPDHPVVFAGNSEPFEAPFVSTGFVAVHRSVFERLSETLPLCHRGWNDRGADTSFWPFYMPFVIPWEGDGNMYLSEDWAFCQRAKDAGFKVWVDPSFRLGHYGQTLYTLEDLLRPAKDSPAPMVLHREHDGSLRADFVPKEHLV
jgi:hypothetical protein